MECCIIMAQYIHQHELDHKLLYISIYFSLLYCAITVWVLCLFQNITFQVVHLSFHKNTLCINPYFVDLLWSIHSKKLCRYLMLNYKRKKWWPLNHNRSPLSNNQLLLHSTRWLLTSKNGPRLDRHDNNPVAMNEVAVKMIVRIHMNIVFDSFSTRYSNTQSTETYGLYRLVFESL